MKRQMCVAAISLLSLGGFVLAARSGWLRPDEANLRARYALPNSQFPLIDGQSIHLVDEGQGMPILLVHGSFASLRMWDSWAVALRPRHRVIRFDRPPMGLSGPSPQQRYGPQAEAALIGALADRFALRRFILVATSSGGEAVASYAAQHPDRVAGVIFANIAAGPIAMRQPDYDWWFRFVLWADPKLNGWHLPCLWEGVLEHNFADPAKVTPELVGEWTDLNNRAQAWPRKLQPGRVPFAQTPADLARIKAPALVLWSDRDPEVPLDIDGRVTLDRLGSARKSLATVRHCGHMMPIECGPESVALASGFIDAVAAGDQTVAR